MKGGCSVILIIIFGLMLFFGMIFESALTGWVGFIGLGIVIFAILLSAKRKRFAVSGGWPDFPVPTNKIAALEYRREWLAYPERYCILDTETTGLAETDEIIDIAIIDMSGNVLLDTLVKPAGMIPAESTRIHGITAAMVKDAPTWQQVSDMVTNAVGGKEVIIFNASYDIKLIRQTDKLYNMVTPPFKTQCLMRNLHVSIGTEKKWPRLSEMAEYYEIATPKSHRALADCQTTLAVLKASV